MITTADLKRFLKNCSVNDEIFIDTDYCSLLGRIKSISSVNIWVEMGITRDESVVISCEDINSIYKVMDAEHADKVQEKKDKLLKIVCEEHNISVFDEDGERKKDNIILYELAQIWNSLMVYEQETLYYVFDLDKDFFGLIFPDVSNNFKESEKQ